MALERVILDLSKPVAERVSRVALTAAELADRGAVEADAAPRVAAAANETTLRDRADAALDTLENAWGSWGTLTAAQKDAALKLNVRVTIALARLVLRKLDKT